MSILDQVSVLEKQIARCAINEYAALSAKMSSLISQAVAAGEFPWREVAPNGVGAISDEEGGGYSEETRIAMAAAGFRFYWYGQPYVSEKSEAAVEAEPETPTPEPEPKRKTRVRRYIGEVEQLCL